MGDLTRLTTFADFLETAEQCEPFLTPTDLEDLRKKEDEAIARINEDWSYLADKVVGYE